MQDFDLRQSREGASVKSSVSRPHNLAGGNGRLQKMASAVARRLYADFYNKIGTKRTWSDVPLESVKRTEADIAGGPFRADFVVEIGIQMARDG